MKDGVAKASPPHLIAILPSIEITVADPVLPSATIKMSIEDLCWEFRVALAGVTVDEHSYVEPADGLHRRSN